MKDDVLDKLTIPSPCSENWNEMKGGNEIRSCDVCEKNVYDLSAISRRDAVKLLKDSGGKICVRIEKTATGKVINRPDMQPKLINITRRAAVAAGVLAASLTLASTTYSQGSPRSFKKTELTKSSKQNDRAITITGKVKDQFGEAAAHLTVNLLHEASGKSFTAIADASGNFRLENLKPGKYIVSIVTSQTHIGNKMEFEFTADAEIELVAEVMSTITAGIPLNLPKLPNLVTILGSPVKASAEIKDVPQTEALITGIVFDGQDARVPDAKVTLTSENGEDIRYVTSDEVGNYAFNNVEPGRYSLRAEWRDNGSSAVYPVKVVKGKTLKHDISIQFFEVVGELIYQEPLLEIRDEPEQKPSSHIEPQFITTLPQPKIDAIVCGPGNAPKKTKKAKNLPKHK